MAAKDISLKLFVHKDKNQILYAESGNDFVDVLISFLTIPIGTIIRLTAKQSKMGCLDNLYGSVEDLDVKYFQTKSCKNMLLHPKRISEDRCRSLSVNVDDTKPANYYLCNNSPSPLRSGSEHLISTVSKKKCRCGTPVSWKIPREKPKKCAGDGKDGVFVEGKMRFMIIDDLQVSPVCTKKSLDLLKRFGVSDAAEIEERNVSLGQEEVCDCYFFLSFPLSFPLPFLKPDFAIRGFLA